MQCGLRGLLLMAGLSVAGAAMASFELMYLPDATTGKITRWDPISKINLGSFGFPDSPSAFQGVTAGQDPGGYAYASNSSGTRVFDPNTDTLIQTNAFFNLPLRADPSGSRLFATSSTAAYSIDPTTFASTFRSLNLTNSMSAMPVNDSVVWFHGLNSANALSLQRMDMTTGVGGAVTTLVSASALAASTSTHSYGARFVTGAGAKRLALSYITNVNTVMLIIANLDAAEASVTSFSSISISGFSTVAAPTAIVAHDGFWLVGDDATTATTTRFMRFDGVNTVIANYTTTAVNVPTTRWAGTNVIAPEPSTFYLMGLGLVGVMVRRRRR